MIIKAFEQLFSAKSMTITLICIGLAAFCFLFASMLLVAFHADVFAHLKDLYYAIFGGNVTAVGRNIVSDGIMPRVPMAVGARTDPSVAVLPPAPMTPVQPPMPVPPPPTNSGGTSS